MSRSTYSRFITVGHSLPNTGPQKDDYVPSDDLQSQISDAGEASYDTVSLYLTNERWKARWQKMCLGGSDTQSTQSNASQSEQSPIRVKIENTEDGQFKVAPGPKVTDIEMEAELWRAGGGFQREEVNIARNGGLQCYQSTNGN